MPEYKGMPLRHELKFIINDAEYLWLRDRLFLSMLVDSNASEQTRSYHIRSLYFDDAYNSAMWDKQDGLEFREKFRIRLYDLSDKVIHLEKKLKLDYYTGKLSCPLTHAECDKILKGDILFLAESKYDLQRDLYSKMRSNVLRPRVIVDYDREAYTYPTGNVRITFDKDIHSGQFSTDIFNAFVSPLPILEPGTMVLEIKYDDFMPIQIKNIVQGLSAQRTAFSKYAMCRRYH